MMAQIIDGKSIAKEVRNSIKAMVMELEDAGISPTLALINASSDPASDVYIRQKERVAADVGITTKNYTLGPKAKASEVSSLINELNSDRNIHAILLQSPLASHLSFRNLVNLINPDKDVDGLTTLNQGRLFSGEPGIVPCTPLGVLHLLRLVHKELAGLHAVVLGRSSIVGKPLAQLLLNVNCTVTLLHSYSQDLEKICRTADILVSAIGKPEFIDEEFIKPGATVIDVGVNRIEDNGSIKIVGDVCFDRVSKIAGHITPVPNGVGPMTVAYLMHNTIKLACCY